MIKISIIYDSKTGNTQAVAKYMADGMNETKDVEARIFHYSDMDEEFVKESQGIVFGSPTYMAGPTADFYTWLEESGKKLNLEGKMGGVFATEQYIHGGADLTMNSLLIHLLIYGMMVYSGGRAFGKPVIHLGPVEVSPEKEKFEELFKIYGRRFAQQIIKISK